MEHRGYYGSVNRDEDDGSYWGLVQHVPHILLYVGRTGTELETNFRRMVDGYVEALAKEKAEEVNPQSIVEQIKKDWESRKGKKNGLF